MAESRDAAISNDDGLIISLTEADLKIKIVPEVMRLLRLEKWTAVGHWCMENQALLAKMETHGDGLQVLAGDSWGERFEKNR